MFLRFSYWILKFSGFKYFQVLFNFYEIKSSRYRTAKSKSETPSEGESNDTNNQTGIITESPKNQTCVHPNKNPTKSTQQSPTNIDKSYSEIITG